MPRCINSSCLPPEEALAFSLPNGDHLLPRDTAEMVTVPGGEITNEGINTIYRYIRNSDYYPAAGLVVGIGTQAKDEKGVRWSKRFAMAAYKEYNLKIPDIYLSHIGLTVETHSKGFEAKVLVTRDLNRSPRYFAHDGSCLWQSEYSTRCMMKSNGGFGLLTYEKRTELTPVQWTQTTTAVGRIWVMPLMLRPGSKPGKYDRHALIPTFNTTTPDAYVLFNGYGTLVDFQGAKILAAMTGMTYTKVQLEINGMYINTPAGYVVMRPDLAQDYKPNRDGVAPWIQFKTRVHGDLFDYERALWIEALAEGTDATADAISQIAALAAKTATTEEKERARREQYNAKRRQQRALAAAAAAAQVPGPPAVPDFGDDLDDHYVPEGALRG